VAVLPFLNLGSDPDNEYFADGITEDVIAQLSKLPSLRVISRASVMKFKSREAGLREIAAQLGVSVVLDGSVRRAGQRVRIVAQLIDAASDQHLWAETYDRELTTSSRFRATSRCRLPPRCKRSDGRRARAHGKSRPPTTWMRISSICRDATVSCGSRPRA
jgi:TolB-like protein